MFKVFLAIIIYIAACQQPSNSATNEKLSVDNEEELIIDQKSEIDSTIPIKEDINEKNKVEVDNESSYEQPEIKEEVDSEQAENEVREKQSEEIKNALQDENETDTRHASPIEDEKQSESNTKRKENDIYTTNEVRNSTIENESKNPTEKVPVEDVKLDHTIFDELLKKFVRNGKVDYAGFKSERNKLNDYLKYLAENEPEKSANRDLSLAYWINVYNAYTIKLIIDNYPLKSITDLEGGKPWDKKWIAIGSSTYSLNNIENDIIRPRFQDPRIHFAVNCAAVSCPPLASQAYTESNLNSLLDNQTKAFINNSDFNKIGPNSIKVSKIFEWYAVDFGDLRKFLDKYYAGSIDKSATISYLEYDWALNGK